MKENEENEAPISYYQDIDINLICSKCYAICLGQLYSETMFFLWRIFLKTLPTGSIAEAWYELIMNKLAYVIKLKY